MKTASPEYLRAITQSHPVSIRAELLLDGSVELSDVPVLGGSVSVDYNSESRRSVQGLTLVDTTGDLLPRSSHDLLTPYGTEVRLWYGVGAHPRSLVPGTLASYTTSDDQEWISFATCRISVVEVSDDGAPQVTVEGFDRSRTIARNLFTTPYIIGAGTNYVTAISAMVQDRLPGVTMDLVDGVTDTTPLIVIDPESNPWGEITKMATTIGCDAYFDSDGQFVLAVVADPATAEPVWTYREGQDSILVSSARRLDDDPGYNGVVLTAESTTIPAPLRSEVWDTNPNSPTYVDGRYGRVPKFVSSPYPTTQAQADAFANAELARIVGGTEQVTLATVPHPLHEPGDCVRVVRAASGMDQAALVDSFTIPIGVTESMPINLRRRRTA